MKEEKETREWLGNFRVEGKEGTDKGQFSNDCSGDFDNGRERKWKRFKETTLEKRPL